MSEASYLSASPDVLDDLNSGIAIKLTEDGGRHIGIVYKKGTDIRLLHLAWHHDLQDIQMPLDKGYFVASFNLSEPEKLVLAGIFAKVYENARQVPYGINCGDTDGIIQPDGTIIPLPLGKGFTCATFIAALLNAFGYEVVNCKTWKKRLSDISFHKKIIKAMRGKDVDPNHIKQVCRDVGARRLRPEELAGACTLPDWPITFPQAEIIAKRVMQDMAVE